MINQIAVGLMMLAAIAGFIVLWMSGCYWGALILLVFVGMCI